MGNPRMGTPDPEARLNDHATRQLALEPEVGIGADASLKPLRRAAKIVGDVLWWSFLTVVFGSITIGVATELLL